MKHRVIASVLGLALLASGTSDAADSSSAAARPRPQAPVQREALPIKPQSVPGSEVIMCYSCGNYYPNRAARVQLGRSYRVYEYGPGCTNPYTVRIDSAPELCAGF